MSKVTEKACEIRHIEIPARGRLPAMKAFYETVFGWEVQQNMPAPDYWLFSAGQLGGGFCPRDASDSAGPMISIHVDDIPAALKKIEAAGGKKGSEKTEIGNGLGYYAFFKDPAGNLFTVWSKK
jgi:uncharacterized protein